VYAKTREVRTALLLAFSGVFLLWVLARIWRTPAREPERSVA
jgi:hypothetical protein